MQYDIILEYPWNQSQLMKNPHEWIFLPDPVHPPAAYKLVGKFLKKVLVFTGEPYVCHTT